MLLRSLPRSTARVIKPAHSCKHQVNPHFHRTISAAARPSAGTFTQTNQPSAPQAQQTRSATAHAISNPTLAGIEKRWEGMPPQEQAELWMQLRDRMKVSWHEMTLQEKKAGELKNDPSFTTLRTPGKRSLEPLLRFRHCLAGRIELLY